MKQSSRSSLLIVLTLALMSLCPSASAFQEADDYLTPQEINQLKEAQEIHLRVKVLMKIAERRLLLLENPAAEQARKDEREWGALPKASPITLLNHYVKVLDETIINIEDAHAREVDAETLYKALKTFREATEQQLPRLRALHQKVTGDDEKATLQRAIEAAELAHSDAADGEKQLAEQVQKKKKPARLTVQQRPSSASIALPCERGYADRVVA